MAKELPVDINVVEIGCGVAGAVAGRHLLHLGATVSHVCVTGEFEGVGCDLRQQIFAHFMHGKSLVEAESAGNGQGSLAAAVGGSDVVIWDGSVANVSLSELEVMAPRALLLVFSASGWTGEMTNWADGAEAEALSGILGTTGFAAEGPLPLGFLFAEIYGGIRGAAAALERLRSRRDGPQSDRLVDVALADCCIEAMENPFQELAFGGQAFPLAGSHRGGMMPYGLFEGRDGYVGLVAASGAWETFARKMGRPDLAGDPELATVQGRIKHRDKLLPAIKEWVNGLPTVDAAVDIIGDDAIAARVLDLWQVRGQLPYLFNESADGTVLPASPYLYD